MRQHKEANARLQFVSRLQAGQDWRTAANECGLTLTYSNVCRLRQLARTQPELVLFDGREGHPYKLLPHHQAWIAEFCRPDPKVSTRVVQQALAQHFNLSVSLSQINRVRAAQGCSAPWRGQPKKNLENQTSK